MRAALAFPVGILCLVVGSAAPLAAEQRENETASAAVPQVPQDPARLAYVTTQWGLADVNRCAVDPIGDLNSAWNSDPNYLIGYRSGGDSCSIPSPVIARDEIFHRQSIQRIFASNRNYLVVSSSLTDEGYDAGFTAGFDIVEMANRRAKACKLDSGGVTSSDLANCEDRVVAYLGVGNTTADHAGGMQALGRYVSIAYEGGPNAHFRVADLNDPSRPLFGEPVYRQRGRVGKFSSTCFTKLADGRFLLIGIGDSKDETDAEVFVSTGTRMSLSASFWQSVNHRGLSTEIALWEEYENFQCVTACDGRLFAVATHRWEEWAPWKEDWADLWQISLDPATFYPTFNKVANRHMYCNGWCDFDAGAGPYVDPNGKLYLYAVEAGESTARYNPALAVTLKEFVPSQAATCIGATCLEGSCYAADGAGYISHYTGAGCTGTEYYYTPYFGFGYRCRPWDNGNAVCGASVVNDTVRSYRDAAGNCNTAWSSGNPLTHFARVYRVACGEDVGCVKPDGAGYFSHYAGPNCSGTEYYYTPYFSNGFKCRPGDPSGAICGNLRYNATVKSVRDANGVCTTPWPNGNPLTNFARVYR